MVAEVQAPTVECPVLGVTFGKSSWNFVPTEKQDKLLENTEEKSDPKSSDKQLGLFEFRTKIVWFNAIGFLLMHLAGIYGHYNKLFLSMLSILVPVMLLVFLGGEGITIGAHRLWTHRSFKATLPLQLLLITFQTLAGQNCCYIWARDHRQHHKYSDTDADPHNAGRGFFFSHIGWLMMKKHPEVLKKGKNIDMSDLEANPVVMFQKKYYKPLYFVIAMLIPVLTPVYLWNESFVRSVFINFFGRYILLLNITWCVNSVAHMFGTKPYDKDILPVESSFVSFIGLGEGWHNYHHVFPWDYKASEFGMKYNMTATFIEIFSKIGWAYDLREASHTVVSRRIQRSGDGTHPIYSQDKYSKEKEEIMLKEYLSKHMGTELEEEPEVAKDYEEMKLRQRLYKGVKEEEKSERTGLMMNHG
ncbi:UNVERIFIED_CONTAM: hypothetical protein PYX00_002905 [Menopon gallinae]|uniref:Fatty acid desaturase domain-containing protein n=1 Tax=Menopon gallinae TaxID=328185 RepID=A0AAW2HZM6_9NEOP